MTNFSSKDFYSINNQKFPSLNDVVIVFYEGEEHKAKYVEWMNGSAFGFLLNDQFIPQIHLWKSP